VLWLFTQMFVLCAGAFLAGSLLTWLPMRAVTRGLRAGLATTPRPLAALAPPAVVVVPEQCYESEVDVDLSEVDPPVKGNSKSRIFHTETSPYYRRMKGDVRFHSTEEAERAGYTAWSPRSRAQLADSVR
jgi:hypothetical protein